MFTLTIQAATADELQKKVMERASLGALAISVYSPEQLLEELRTRLRPQGLVVNIEHFAGETVADSGATSHEAVAAETDPPRQTRKSKPKNEAKPEEPKTVQPDTATAKAMVDAPAALTREDVTKALVAYAEANGGQVAARKVMQDVGGSIKLAEIPTDKWPELVKALTVGAA